MSNSFNICYLYSIALKPIICQAFFKYFVKGFLLLLSLQLTAAVCCYLNSITDNLCFCQQVFFTVWEILNFRTNILAYLQKKVKHFCFWCVCFARVLNIILNKFLKIFLQFPKSMLCFLVFYFYRRHSRRRNNFFCVLRQNTIFTDGETSLPSV